MVLQKLYCSAAHSDTHLMEFRKSALINGMMQKFQQCQITLLGTQSSDIQFFSRNSQSIQIFVLPFPYTEEILLKILKVKQKSYYPIFYGLQYIHKFSTPVCKLKLYSLQLQTKWIH